QRQNPPHRARHILRLQPPCQRFHRIGRDENLRPPRRLRYHPFHPAARRPRHPIRWESAVFPAAGASRGRRRRRWDFPGMSPISEERQERRRHDAAAGAGRAAAGITEANRRSAPTLVLTNVRRRYREYLDRLLVLTVT